MKEKELENIIKSIDTEVTPPSGLKEKILVQVLNKESPALSGFERFIFERPLRAACVLSIFISGVLWAVMGNGYAGILSGLMGQR